MSDYTFTSVKTYQRSYYNRRLTKKLLSQSLKGLRHLILEIIKFSNKRKTQKTFFYCLAILLLVYMFLWNWQIVVATTAGVAIMVAVYTLQTWPSITRLWQEHLSGLNRKLMISVVSGGLSAITTFGFACIWSDVENRWLAVGSILQGLGTLLVVSLLGWQIWDKGSKQNDFDSYLVDLTNSDPLKRLIAIRQLAGLQNSTHPLQDYYKIMLSREKDPLVKKALLEALAQDQQPLNIPIKVSQKVAS